MEIILAQKPELISGQYFDNIDDYTLIFNPLSSQRPVIVDEASRCLINRCNGINTVEDIIKLEKRDANLVINEIHELLNAEIISIPEFVLDKKKTNVGKKILTCWLHITNRCNLACSYCYVNKSMEDMQSNVWKMTIDKMVETSIAKDFDGISIKFAGGEPLLDFHTVKEIIEYSQQYSKLVNISYSIVTNGTLVTKEIADFLKMHNAQIGLSLDGIGPVNDKTRFYCDGSGSFDDIVEGIKTLKESGNRVNILVTVSDQNYNNLPQITKFAVENDLGFRFSMEKDCTSGHPTLLDHMDELIESLTSSYDYLENNLPERDIFRIHLFGDVSLEKSIKRCCGAGSSFFAMSHDGQFGMCGMGLSDPFSSIFECSDIVDTIRNHAPDLCNNSASNYDECRSCYWRTSCAGACPMQTYATYGKYSTASPYCKVHKVIIPKLLKIKGLQMIKNSQESAED